MCIHYWILDPDNQGKCIKCPESKDFSNTDNYINFDEEYSELVEQIGN